MKQNIYILTFILICLVPQPGRCQLIGPPVPQRPPTDLDRKIDTFLQASIDLVKQSLLNPSYAGTPYASSAPTPGDVLALNLAIQFHNQGLIQQILNYYQPHSYRRLRPADLSTLVASSDTLPGPAGATVKAPFISHISLLYGFQLIGKGGKLGTSTTRMTYLEAPAYLLYNHDLPNQKGRLFGGLGIYLAYGLWGKISDAVNPQTFPAFDKMNGYKRFDAGLAFTAGCHLPKGLRLSLAYELGLVNIDPVGGSYDKTKNRSLSLNVAYPFRNSVSLTKKK